MPRVRQLAWVAADLASAERAVVDALGLEPCFRDPGVAEFGLENAVFPIGDQFLEIVAPTRPDAAGARHLARRERDAAGYMVIVQTDHLDPVRRRAADAGVRVVFEATGGSGPTAITGLHLHPADIGGAIVSVDRSVDATEWAWAGPAWREHVRTDVVSEIVGFTVAVPDPDATAERWSTLLGGPLDGAEFVEGDGGLVGISLRGPAEQTIDLLGTTVRIAP